MMDTIGKLKQIRDYMNSSPFPKPEFGDACDEAIKALENQPKYERALKLQAKQSTCCSSYGECDDCGQSDQEIEKCIKASVDFFKKQAGLDVD